MSLALRTAPRVVVRIPALIEKLGQQPLSPDVEVAHVLERITPEASQIGVRAPGIIVDLSENGCFVAGPPLPLLSRCALSFSLPGFGQAEAIGWVFWRRTQDVTLEAGGEAPPRVLPAGVGLMFEALSIRARQAILKLIESSQVPGA